MGYTVNNFGNMISDTWRMNAYVSAVKKHINKDTVVLDLGAGTGIFSLLACKFGAKKVYAIEPNTALNVGIVSARKNGFADRIEFFNKPSNEVQLKEKVDLIISDLRGVLPLLGNNIETIIDAKERFLKNQGTLIPASDNIYMAIVNSPKLYKDIVNKWDRNPYNFTLKDEKNICLNNFYPENFKYTKLISDKKLWTLIDYSKLERKDFSNKLEYRFFDKKTAHGFSVWFDSKLTPGVKLLNSPDMEGAKVYGRAFFPFLEPLSVNKGDKITIKFSANLVSNEYIWSWQTEKFQKNKKVPVKRFNQSTFFSIPISPELLLKRTQNYKTSLNESAKINLEVLKLFSNNKKIVDIAKTIRKKFPKKFNNIDDAISLVGDLSVKYSN